MDSILEFEKIFFINLYNFVNNFFTKKCTLVSERKVRKQPQ